MKKLANRVKVSIGTIGTGNVTFGAALSSSFFIPSDAPSLSAGDVVAYTLLGGGDVEQGYGTIQAGVTSMSRDVVRRSKIGGVVGTTLMDLDGNATLFIAESAEDLMFAETHGADIASASTLNLETATGEYVHVTGTTTITAVTLLEGHERWVQFTGACQITVGSSLIGNAGGGNVTTAAGDFGYFRGDASGVVWFRHFPANGKSVVPPAGADLTGTSLASGIVSSSLTSLGTLTSLAVSGQITSTETTGTAPFVVASTTNVANLNASSLNGATFAAPGAIGSGTASTGAFTTLSATSTVSGAGITSLFASPPNIGATAPGSGAFTSLSATGQITSTETTGTAPFVVASTTNVANLNASSLNGATFAAPGAIGSGTASTGAFTTLSASSTVSGAGFSTYLASPPAIGGTAPAAAAFTSLTLARHAVADAAYVLVAGIATVAYTSITAARAVTLVAASTFGAGQQLLVVDESGSCSATLTITLNRAGSDTINGGTSVVLNSAYAYVVIESNGDNAWTIVDQSTLSMAQQAASAVAITGGSISGTITGAITWSGAQTFSSAITYGGVTLANAVTGTGAMVLASNATLVAPALGTPASGTLTNCTFPTLNQNTSGSAASLSATLVPASGGTGVNNGSATITLAGSLTQTGAYASTFAMSGAYTYTMPGASCTLANLTTAAQVQVGGVHLTCYSIGIISTGTTAIDCGNNPQQFMGNNGASTLVAPTNDGNCLLQVVNLNSAGTITLSGFATSPTGSGDTFATANTASGTATFTNGSASIGFTNTFVPGQVIYFTTSSALPTNFLANTPYYVLSTALSGSNIEVSATPGGSAISAGSAGSGTQTGHVPSVFMASIIRINGLSTLIWKQQQ